MKHIAQIKGDKGSFQPQKVTFLMFEKMAIIYIPFTFDSLNLLRKV